MQCAFMSGSGTTDAIFIVCQPQEKHSAAKQAPLHGLRRPGETFRSCSMGYHLMGNAQTRNRQVAGVSGPVHVRGREEQGKMGIARSSVLSPLLFIVLEALSREFHTGRPWELLYADDLMKSP